MTTQITKRQLGVLATAVMLGGFLGLPVIAYPQNTVTRPIADFLSAQGTFCLPDGGGGCLLFVPPVPNFLGLSTPGPPVRCASVDYAGVANAWLISQGGTALGTQTGGTIVERTLPDGRAELTVLLSTKKALTWVVDGCDFAGGTLLFGRRTPDVLAGLQPSLGDSFMQWVFINTAPGDPLPDLVQLLNVPLPGQELRFVGFRAQADGELRAAFGVPDGTPGQATIVQTAVLMASFKGATADGFPAEMVNLKVTGK